jgi:hypothetical protein
MSLKGAAGGTIHVANFYLPRLSVWKGAIFLIMIIIYFNFTILLFILLNYIIIIVAKFKSIKALGVKRCNYLCMRGGQQWSIVFLLFIYINIIYTIIYLY